MKKIVFIAIAILFSTTIAKAQEDKKSLKENLYVELKEGAKPTIYVDGKEFGFSMELINQDKIASVFVVKGEEAIKKYNAPNGVVLIKTKDLNTAATSKLEVKNVKTGAITKLEIEEKKKVLDKDGPMIIMDGKVVDREILEKINSSDIKSMQVLKGKAAIKEYNSPNGVIIITTKTLIN